MQHHPSQQPVFIKITAYMGLSSIFKLTMLKIYLNVLFIPQTVALHIRTYVAVTTPILSGVLTIKLLPLVLGDITI